MKLLKEMLVFIGLLWVGSIMNTYIPLPIPATVYGMILLFILLSTKKIKVEQIKTSSNAMLNILAFLFVPSGVSLIEHANLLKGNVIAILISLILSLFITVFVTGHVVQYIVKKEGIKNGK